MILLGIFDRLFGSMISRTANAAQHKAKMATVGKARAKVMGAQARAQQKVLRKMDKGMNAVGEKAKGSVQGGGGQQQAQAQVPVPTPGGPAQVPTPGGPPQAAAGAPYQPVNEQFVPVMGSPQQVAPEAQPQMNQMTCPNGHPLDPSWEVCPYCRQAEQQGVKPVHVQANGGGAVAGKTMAVNLDEVMGSQHVNKAVVGWLVCMHGPQKGQDFRLFDGRNVLRTAADCDVVVYDPYVAARHCVIMIESGNARYIIQDLDSRNHTFVNNRQVMKQDLIDNDEVKLGSVQYRFKALY